MSRILSIKEGLELLKDNKYEDAQFPINYRGKIISARKFMSILLTHSDRSRLVVQSSRKKDFIHQEVVHSLPRMTVIRA